MGAARVLTTDTGSGALLDIIQNSANLGLAILDYNMPGMVGLQLLWSVRCGFEGIRRNLPVILLTGNSDRRLVEVAKELDVNGFLTKPVSRADMVSRALKAVNGTIRIKPAAEYQKIPIASLVTKFGRISENPQIEIRNDRALLLSDVNPPAVVTRPISGPDGNVLVPEGTKVTKPLLDHLKALPSGCVERIWVE